MDQTQQLVASVSENRSLLALGLALAAVAGSNDIVLFMGLFLEEQKLACG